MSDSMLATSGCISTLPQGLPSWVPIMAGDMMGTSLTVIVTHMQSSQVQEFNKVLQVFNKPAEADGTPLGSRHVTQ